MMEYNITYTSYILLLRVNAVVCLLNAYLCVCVCVCVLDTLADKMNEP